MTETYTPMDDVDASAPERQPGRAPHPLMGLPLAMAATLLFLIAIVLVGQFRPKSKPPVNPYRRIECSATVQRMLGKTTGRVVVDVRNRDTATFGGAIEVNSFKRDGTVVYRKVVLLENVRPNARRLEVIDLPVDARQPSVKARVISGNFAR